jgi:hypothetical protein
MTLFETMLKFIAQSIAKPDGQLMLPMETPKIQAVLGIKIKESLDLDIVEYDSLGSQFFKKFLQNEL